MNMSDMPLSVLLAFILIVLGSVIWSLYGRKRSYRKFIEPQLQAFDCEYISEEAPRLFDTGPFPRVEFHWGKTES